jgi:hypothetical protein
MKQRLNLFVLLFILLIPQKNKAFLELGCIFCSPNEYYFSSSKLIPTIQKNEFLVGVGAGSVGFINFSYAPTKHIVFNQSYQDFIELFNDQDSYVNTSEIVFYNLTNNFYYAGNIGYGHGKYSLINAKQLNFGGTIGISFKYVEAFYSLGFSAVKHNYQQVINYYEGWTDLNEVYVGKKTHLFNISNFTMNAKLKNFKLGFQFNSSSLLDHNTFDYNTGNVMLFLSYQFKNPFSKVKETE